MGVIFFHPSTWVYSVLEDRRKRYFGHHYVGKRICMMFIRVGYQQSTPTGPYMDRGIEPRNVEMSWNGKLIGKLLLTITVADPE